MTTFRISDWDCPAGLPEGQSGRLRVVKRGQPPGVYYLHGQYAGAEFYEIAKRQNGQRCQFTRLQERRGGKWHDWMTDQPLFWHSMARIAQRSKGPTVLVGGLGLGLVLRHLAVRGDLAKVLVIERSPDVIRLVWESLLSRGVLDKRFQLQEGNFFDFEGQGFDSVVTDFWVGTPAENIDLFLRTFDYVSDHWPAAHQEYHGLQMWAEAARQLPATSDDRTRKEILLRLAARKEEQPRW